MSAPCCAVAARLGPVALAEADAALARLGQPGAETLSAVAARLGIPKGSLSKHKTGCLAMAAQKPGETGRKRVSETRNAESEVAGVVQETRKETRGLFNVPNPGDDPVTAPRKVIAATMERQCIDLRAKGQSYATISAELGIDEGTAQDIVERVLIRTRRGTDAKADQARRLDLIRIDKLLASLWDRATDPSMATVDVPADTETGVRAYDGQDKAIDRVTKLLERRAKLLGLDAPQAVSLSLVDQAEESADFTDLFRVMRKLLDARFPGASAFVTEGLDHFRVRGEPGVDAFLAGDFALPVAAGQGSDAAGGA